MNALTRKCLLPAAVAPSRDDAYAVPALAEDRCIVPLSPTGPAPSRRPACPIVDGSATTADGQRARRRHQRRQARLSRSARRATTPKRASSATRRSSRKNPVSQPLVDRHYAAAACRAHRRQDPDPVHGLRLLAPGRRRRFPWVFNPPATYWDGASMILKDIAQGGRARQAEGQEDRLPPSRRALRQGADPAARGAMRRSRLQLKSIPVGAKDMQNQSSQWLSIRRERPD